MLPKSQTLGRTQPRTFFSRVPDSTVALAASGRGSGLDRIGHESTKDQPLDS